MNFFSEVSGQVQTEAAIQSDQYEVKVEQKTTPPSN